MRNQAIFRSWPNQTKRIGGRISARRGKDATYVFVEDDALARAFDGRGQ
jgi:hypothetical protein